MEAKSHRVPAADGLELNLLEWSTDGTPMLLIHGFSNEAHIWDDFVETVAPFYRVMALDLRGHGDSDWHPEAAYDYDDHVRDLECVLDHLEIDRVVLVAHSLGGRASMLFGGRHPERIAGLVIVDSAPELDPRGTARISIDTAQNQDPSFASVAEYERMLVHAYPAATPAAVRRMAQYGLRENEEGRWVLKMDPAMRAAMKPEGEDQLAQAAERHERYREEMWQALARIPSPTLVVRGAASDIVSAEVADRMVDDVLPQGQLAVVGQAGHSVMTDNPEGFARAVGAFVLGE